MPENIYSPEYSKSPEICAAGEELFNKYQLGKLLGRGAFAKVYHARNLITGQSVAIKSISKIKIAKSNLSAQIMREIDIMRRLQHPHIVKIHEVLATKSKIYVVMDFIKGGELFAKIAKGRFSEDLSRKYFQQLISAVSYCHSRGVFHRDLKLENLLLDENWELKVTDFGLSAVTDQIRPDGMLHTLCGTPAYVAPEILAKKGYDGAKVDFWSCGVILYILNAGYLPFNDHNLMAMYRKIYKGEFRFPKWISPDLRRFLTRILDPNPVTRITVHEMLTDPWFQKGYEETIHPIEKEFEFKEAKEQSRFLNAFDILAFSSGADLSGLVASNDKNRVFTEMFVSGELPQTIIGRIEELAEDEGVCVKVGKRGSGVRLQGQNSSFVVKVEINQLTEELVAVEVKRGGFGLDFWKDKLKPGLNDLVMGPE